METNMEIGVNVNNDKYLNLSKYWKNKWTDLGKVKEGYIFVVKMDRTTTEKRQQECCFLSKDSKFSQQRKKFYWAQIS